MRSLLILAWFIASGVLLSHGAAAGADEGNSANINNPLTIELISEATTINNFVDLGTPGPSPGDTYTFSDKIFADSNPVEQVGQADGHCTLINPTARRFTCTITTSLPDGIITTEGVLIFVPNTTSVGAVTGGTGAYRNARGEAELILGPVVWCSRSPPPRDFFADLAPLVRTESRSCGQSEPLLTDLTAFVVDHRPHGPLTAHATEPAWNGYLLTVACPCGVVFERWVTPGEADRDLVVMALRN